jgi:nitrous oxide reductase accessory protein NosL
MRFIAILSLLISILTAEESLVGKTYEEITLNNDFVSSKNEIKEYGDLPNARINIDSLYANLNKKNEMICPIKGVKISQYKKWLGYVLLKDNSIIAVSSPKYTFVYYNSIKDDAKGVYVTDFDSGKIINAKEAFYVFGSRILSIGGDDVLPFASEKAAKEFIQKNGGTRILKFERMDKNFLDYLELR